MSGNTFNRDYSFDGPCKGCKDRTVEPNCHTDCPRYLEWRKGVDERREKRRAFIQKRDTIGERQLRRTWRKQRYGASQKRTKVFPEN